MKQWLALASQANPDVRPLFDNVQRMMEPSDVMLPLERGRGRPAGSGVHMTALVRNG